MQTDNPVIGGNAPPPIVFTDAAASKVGELIREEANPNLMLRVFISGGGCGGARDGSRRGRGHGGVGHRRLRGRTRGVRVTPPRV